MTQVSLRLLSKAGRYPLYSVHDHANLFICEPWLVWGAVVHSVTQVPEEHSEVAVYRPEEVRLYASVALSESNPVENGALIIEPWTLEETVTLQRDLPDDLRAAEVRDFLGRQAQRIAEQETAREVSTTPHRLPQPDTPYDLTTTGDLHSCLQLLAAIDPTDRLCIRGLSKLLSARALSHAMWFLEEAAMAAYISLAAALEMVRQHLEGERNSTASYQDVYAYVERTFPTGVPLVQFLKEIYDLRTVIVHPSSRFGEFWAPPMLADDCFETIEWLVTLYRHILLGEIPTFDAA